MGNVSNKWWQFAAFANLLLLASCTTTLPVLGFIVTEPVSIPAKERIIGPLYLDVSAVTDTLMLSAPGHMTYAVREVQRTAQFALSKAFDATVAPTVDSLGRYELHLLLLTANYQPMGYYAHTEYRESPFSFGPRMSRTTTTHNNPYSISTAYRAALYRSDSLIATFDNVLDSPGIWTMEENLKKAMERMAEDLNTKVVRFMLGQKDE